jgi:hypothetical protein
MKKTVLLLVLFVFTIASVFAQNARLPRLAVVTFSVNTTREKAKEDAIAIRNFVQSNIVSSGKYDVITRDEIDKLLENQRIQISSISSAENLKKLELQNISYIITGTVDALDNDYGVTISLLDVSTGRFSHSTSQFMSNTSSDIYNKTSTLVRNFQQGMSSEGETVIQTNRSGNTKQYFIGEEGPGGGIVFFDKGEFSDGWRYLEAAPSKAEYTAKWGAYGSDVPGTRTTVGSGRQNTQLIMEKVRQLGEIGTAVQMCTGLELNGYKDWFLPSRDELDLMYKNLKQKGLGSFGNNYYWSSSQDSSDVAWGQGFSSGFQYSYFKNVASSVRAVRAF